MTGALVLGLDEAGRGPALGPLVLAAVALDAAAARRLARLGVTDSKRFGAGARAHRERSRLVSVIESCAAFVGVELCDVAAVDAAVTRGQLNALERERARRLLRAAPPARRMLADGARLFGPLEREFPGLRARDGAESLHVAVAAASLVAKVRRDELFACIAARYAREFGPLGGGGYVNAATRAFTQAFRKRHRALPPEARASWPWPPGARPLRVPDRAAPPAP